MSDLSNERHSTTLLVEVEVEVKLAVVALMHYEHVALIININ